MSIAGGESGRSGAYLNSCYVGCPFGHVVAFREIGRRTREIDPSFSVASDRRMGRFCCTNKGAHEFAVDLLGNGVHINAFASEELARVGNSVDPSGFDAGALEACCLQLRSVFAFLKSASDTADPKQHPLPELLGYVPSRHDVGDRKPTTGLQYPKCFTENLILVGG